MADPISEQLSAKILERLQSIRTDNGFRTTMEVERYTAEHAKQGIRYRNHLLIMSEGDEDSEEEDPQDRETFIKSYVAEYHAQISESDTTPVDTKLNVAAADIIWAITGDPASVHSTGDARQFDGMAVNTTLGGTERFEHTDGSIHGVRVFFQVTYRSSEDNPYTQT